VFAVVQYHEHLSVSQGVHEGVGEQLAGTLLHLQSHGHLLSHQLWLGERRKFYQPHSVRVGADEIPGHL
jgi:hypothetical protein